jgi:NitT/TauT family transport system substrate-binding protein
VGQRLIGHESDVALRTFGALCRHQGMDPASMQVASAWTGMVGMAEEVLTGRAVGAFGYVSTFKGALVAADPALLGKVRFLRYADWVPDLYGSVLMASPRLLHEEPEWVARLLVAVNRGVIDMIREPDAALAALGRVAPGLDSDAERVRLQATLALEMSNELPNGARQPSVGDVDPARLVRGIALMVQGSGLPRTPAATDVFTWAHLPPADARARP